MLRSLIEVGVNLSAVSDLRQMLDMILREARRLTSAEAGSLYIVRDGKLRFATAQNDRLSLDDILSSLSGRELAVSEDSLAGFVVLTGRSINIPDAYSLQPGAPFRVNREFDASTGYRTQSVQAIPLTCPGAGRIGVLELINRVGPGGKIVPFGDEGGEIHSLASMAAVTIHNALLREDLKRAHLDTIFRLSTAAEFRDADTANHLRRISGVSSKIAEEMNLPETQVELLRYASPMHDIGKIGIPDAILLKPGPLTDEERMVVQTHTKMGVEIIGEPTNELLATARDIALCHHERWDGQGYPNTLKGMEIPLSARIVGLADVFDALVFKRCYKPAFPVRDCLDRIEAETGWHFDPEVVRAFFRVLDEILACCGLGEAGGACDP